MGQHPLHNVQLWLALGHDRGSPASCVAPVRGDPRSRVVSFAGRGALAGAGGGRSVVWPETVPIIPGGAAHSGGVVALVANPLSPPPFGRVFLVFIMDGFPFSVFVLLFNSMNLPSHIRSSPVNTQNLSGKAFAGPRDLFPHKLLDLLEP